MVNIRYERPQARMSHEYGDHFPPLSSKRGPMGQEEVPTVEDDLPGNLPYIIGLDWWGASYSFGIDPEHGKEGTIGDPFKEYQALEFRGALIVPTLPKLKRAEGKAWFEEPLNRSVRSSAKPSALGFIDSARGTLHATIYTPQEMYHPLLTLFAAEKIRFIQLNGSRLHYGHAPLRSFDFDFDAPEDRRTECIQIWANDKRSRRRGLGK